MAELTTLKQIREAITTKAGLFLDGQVATGAGNPYTIVTLSDNVPDPYKMRDAFMYKGATSEFRRVLSYAYPTSDQVTLNRDFAAPGAFTAQFYFMIDPEQLNGAIREAHRELYKVTRTAIALINNTNEYQLPDGIHTKAQVLGIYYRDTTGGATNILEESAPAWKLVETGNVVTLHLITNEVNPIFDSTVGLVAVWREYYGSLPIDTSTTTCPRELIIPKAEMAMYTKLFKRHGDAAKRLFGQDMALAEKAYHEARLTIIVPAEARELHIDEPVDLPRSITRGRSW